jgi:hypothetical protein
MNRRGSCGDLLFDRRQEPLPILVLVVLIEAYLARWGYQVRPYLRALPNAADHPVFRIERL